jgi:hypothetical protein
MTAFPRTLMMISALIAMAGSAFAAESQTSRLDGATPEERGQALLRHLAAVRPSGSNETYPKAAAPYYAARLALGVDLDYALEKLDAAATHRIAIAKDRIARQAEYDAADDKSKLKKPGAPLDPFDKAALVHTYFIGKPHIPKSTALKSATMSHCGATTASSPDTPAVHGTTS